MPDGKYNVLPLAYCFTALCNALVLSVRPSPTKPSVVTSTRSAAVHCGRPLVKNAPLLAGANTCGRVVRGNANADNRDTPFCHTHPWAHDSILPAPSVVPSLSSVVVLTGNATSC
jgi:hypothetical protein